MLKIDYKHIAGIHEAKTFSDLIPFVKSAVALEHATLPPYLTAYYSIVPGTNKEVADTILDVAIEEMLHMCIACNLLNAIGGKVDIHNEAFIPHYPTHLPLDINHALEISCEKVSIKQLTEVFMEIEEPEHPLEFLAEDGTLFEDEHPVIGSIGLFYTSIQKQFLKIGGNLPGDPSLQITQMHFPGSELFGIYTVDDAAKAIEVIIEQGEGSAHKPVDLFNDLAHYYRFAEVAAGRKLIEDASAPGGFSYTGREIHLDENGIHPIHPNTRLKELPEGTEGRIAAEKFAKEYTLLLENLHQAFNGHPDRIKATFSGMHALSALAEKLVTMPYPGKPEFTVGPVFSFFKPE